MHNVRIMNTALILICLISLAGCVHQSIETQELHKSQGLTGGIGSLSNPYTGTVPFLHSDRVIDIQHVKYYRFKVRRNQKYAVQLLGLSNYAEIEVKERGYDKALCITGGVKNGFCHVKTQQNDLLVKVYPFNESTQYQLKITPIGSDKQRPGFRSLNKPEQSLSRTWGRKDHVNGNTRYYILNRDRTACYFETNLSGKRLSQVDYPHWELRPTEQKSVFTVVRKTEFGGEVGSDEFNVAEMEMWRGGYEQLSYTPVVESKSCKV